jgi:guanosine-3',5'-bis(diphosphate) 3'-pyrophosphohydrolase
MQNNFAKSQDAIEQAVRLAIHYHAGQRDKEGQCYILHLLRVMMACSSSEAMQVAVLHDVLEDTSATVDELHAAGMSSDVVEAISLLTKPDNMRYDEYIVRLADNSLARQVKMADIHDNYRLDRVAYRKDYRHEDRQRIERYILSHSFLAGKLSRDEYLERVSTID